MCYRYTLATPREDLITLFGIEPPLLEPRYNIALTQAVPAVRLVEGTRNWGMFRFGLIPRWSRDPKPAGFGNARGETVAEKPAFRDAFQKRRCLVAADGFYEWETVGKQKLPWRITLANGGPFAFAGIWETWTNPEGRAIDSLAILTAGAIEPIAHFHDRSPVILDREHHDRYLTAPADSLTDLIAPYPAPRLRAFRVGTQVNRTGYRGADCIEPVPA